MQAAEPVVSLEPPVCPKHKLSIKYICKDDACKNDPLACPDCLYYFHSNHIKKVLKIDSTFSNLVHNYSKFR